jgi:hypothetical protein
VVAEPLREAGPQRQRGVDRVVAGAAGDHDVGAHVERLEVRLDAHHRDDALRLVEVFEGERAVRTERLDLLRADALAQVVERHLGMDPDQAERVELVPSGDLLDDLDVIGDAASRPGAAGRADDQRDLALAGGDQQQLEVEVLPLARVHRLVRAQEVGAAVAAAGVGADEVQRALDPLVERGRVDRLVAERAGGRNGGHLTGHGSLLVAYPWVSRPAARYSSSSRRSVAATCSGWRAAQAATSALATTIGAASETRCEMLSTGAQSA